MTIKQYIYVELCKAGTTLYGACAILGQIQKESGFIPNNVENGRSYSDTDYTRDVDNGSYSRQKFISDGIGYGIAQWTWSPRKGDLYDFWKESGVSSIGDYRMQTRFLLWEMQHKYFSQWRHCCSCDEEELYDCVKDLLYNWENPDEKENNLKERYKYAQSFVREFQNYTPKETWTEESAVKAVLDLARSEVGYLEKASNSQLDDKTANAGAGNWTKYARDLDSLRNFYNGGKNGYPWCDIFYDWLFVKCFGAELGRQMLCQPLNSAGAGCMFSVQYYKQYGRWYAGTPEPGDQIFFSYAPGEYSHTGIVESVSGGVITTIEGNTSESVGRRSYAVGSSTIAGYGRPRWELAANTSPSDISFGPSESSERILKLGCRGEDVRQLQKDLLKMGYDVGPDGADGDYGDNTKRAVMKFQREHHLEPVDGEVGDDTRKVLNEVLKKPESSESSTTESEAESDTGVPRKAIQIREIKMEDEGADVKLAQAALLCWGYTIVVTGIFGKEMQQKITDFQKHFGLQANGIVDLETWRKLLEINAN